MAKAFKDIKTAYGLGDILLFPRHYGEMVLRIIHEDPNYIDWLMRHTDTRFHDSVYEELDKIMPEIPRNTNINRPCYIYTGELRGDLAHYQAELEAIAQDNDDWFDDIPF